MDQPDPGLICAIDSIERVTRAVQGGLLGLLGLLDRKQLTDKAGQALASIGGA